MLKPKCFSLALSLLFLLLPFTSASPSFTTIQNHFFSPNLTCIQGEFYNCSSTCPCYISQDYYHFTTIGVSFVTLIWCTLFLLAFIYVNELREKPGETIFMATLANLFLSVSFGIQNAKLLANDDNNDVRDNDRSCVVLGFFTAFFVNMISVYQLVFYAYNMMTLRKPINASRLKRSRYHAFAIIVTLLLTFSELGFGNLGRTLLGTCSVKTTSNYLFPIATTGALFLLECIVALMMKRNFRKRINDLNTKQTRYVEHYLSYIIVLCIILLAIGAVAADIAIRVNSELTERTLYQNKDAFNTLQVCSFLLINLIPVLLVIGRIRDPSIWKPLKRKIASCWSSDESLEEESHVEEPQSPEPIVLTMNENPREDSMKKKLLDMDNLPVMNLRSLNSVSPIRLNNPSTPSTPYASSGGSYSPKFGKTNEDSRLAHPNQVSKTKDPHMFYSILAGVHYYWHLKKTKQNEGEQQEEEKRGRKDAEYFKQEAVHVTKFTLHDTLMRHTMPQIYREIKSKHYKIRFGVFTAYAPQLFADLVELDDIATELQSSLELMQNFSNVVSAGTEINKSQFLTYNSKFIVRNITKGDRRALMKILPRYMQHLRTKPYSLLTRIYGLFRFETMSPYQQVNWLIMKNITERSSNSIERMYEVKGVAAQHRRSLETIGTDGERAVLRALGSLGDEYFEKNEHSIYVDPNIKNPLLETLRQDVEFLISEGLYDYSLNVSIMSRAKTSLNQRLSSSVILEVEERLEAWSLVGEESVLRNQRNWDEEGKSHGEITSSKALTRNRMGTSLVSQVNMQNPFFAIKSTKENLYYCLEIDSYLKPFDWKKKMAYYIKGCKDDGSCLQPPAVYGRRLVEYVTQIVSDKESMFGIINRDSHSHTRSENSSIEEKYNNIIEK